jgi:nucleotide-binding universal stress UspA family protein
VSDPYTLSYSSAVKDFQRARRGAALELIYARLSGRSADLLSYEDVRHQLNLHGSLARGVREIPLDAIIGSVARYDDFTRSFLPKRVADAERWANVRTATLQGPGLPPIEVYQIGQAYFVRDGNHRVSVARQFGAQTIMASVHEVPSAVPLSPEIQPDDVILKAEYAHFLQQTHLDTLRPSVNFLVTVPGQYEVLLEQINAHNVNLQQEQNDPLTFKGAVIDWCDAVYLPVMQLIHEQNVLQDFPGRTETDLYVWILQHKALLEGEWGWKIKLAAATTDFVQRRASTPQRAIGRWRSRLRSAAIPAALDAGPPPGFWRHEQQHSHHPQHLFADILVPISGNELGWHALDQALKLVEHEGSFVHGLHVVRNAAMHREAQSVEAEFNRRCSAANVRAKLVVDQGTIADRICERARWVDLVVVGLAFPPAADRIARLRSGFRTLIRRCPRPVLAVPQTMSLKRALLAYDGSPKADEALFAATYMAGQWRLDLVVLTVNEFENQASNVLHRAQSYLATHGVRATFIQMEGPVGETILQTAQTHNSDLLVVGGYGFSPVLEMVLGSTVDQLLRSRRYPMLICR